MKTQFKKSVIVILILAVLMTSISLVLDKAVKVEAFLGTVNQAHYRIGKDQAISNGNLSTYYYAPVDTPATGILHNTNFRIRFQIYNDSINSSTWIPRLEWSTSQTSGYTIVPTSSGSAPFFLNDTGLFTNGATISTLLFGCGTGSGTASSGRAYDTTNPASSRTINANSYTEFEFNIQANANATYGGTYYFRLTDNGAAITSYINYARIVMETLNTPVQARFRIGRDMALSNGSLDEYYYNLTNTKADAIQRLTSFRIRFQTYNSTGSSIALRPQLEWSIIQSSGYAAVPTTSGTAPFALFNTGSFSNAEGILTTLFGCGTGTGTSINGKAYDTENPAVISLALGNGQYTEFEFNVQATSTAMPGKTYYFRLTNNGVQFQIYLVYASISIEPAENPHGSFDAATEKCAICHRTHTAQGKSLTESQSEEIQCLVCHDGTGSSTNISAVLSEAYSHNVYSQTGIHTQGESGSAAFADRHVECVDCHNPHNSGTTAGTAPSVQSHSVSTSSGVSVNNGTLPGKPAYTFINSVTYEYQLCFKCHSSYTSGYTGGDKAAEFNTNNPSFHPVEGTGKDLGISMTSFTAGSGWDTHNYDSTSPKTYCSDCHSSNQASDPAGPHASNVQYILKAGYNHTNSSAVNAALCYLCHKIEVYLNGQSGSRFEKHKLHTTDESMSCYGCHDVHGSNNYRFMIQVGGTSRITSFTSSSTGGSCAATGCHGSLSYSVVYAR